MQYANLLLQITKISKQVALAAPINDNI